MKSHQCDVMKDGPSIESAIYMEDGRWVLTVNRLATEEDLEQNHYLEEVGEPTQQLQLSIVYCPYCGERLQHNKAESIVDFWFHDFSQY